MTDSSYLLINTKAKEKVSWPITIFLIVIAIIFIFFPLYLTVVIALKDPSDMVNVCALPKKIKFQNFVDAWNITEYPRKFANTFLITVLALILTIITNSMVGFAIGRNQKKSRLFNFLYYYFISALFIPFNVIMLPLVKEASAVHIDNILGITFLYIVFGLPMNTLLYTGYIKSIPKELDEAATIDGANTWQLFFKVIFPTMGPINATVVILTVMWTWNDFLMPLVLLSKPEQQTLQLSQYVFQGQFSTNYNLAFASYLMVLLPVLIVYVFCQKWITAGITNGAIKQ
ncbi:binding-protein-dependent transport system inner membrane protein [[Clostridium] cellulosi]|uniref:Binding-protein-dependent transport system inner membrane protein n=1 Tax=[Clostridium] cellulosi TaxID=29343 RepID=A0A078KN79_9FIRM|nr:binding-protein-dependent transport system inner membrane protein [[Clostridium] cellulosi]